MQLTQEEQKKGYLSFMNEVVDPTGSGTVVRRYTAPAPTIPTAIPAPAIPTALPTAVPEVTQPVKPTLGTVDEAAIREETRKRMQANIDAINAQYTTLITQENTAGVDRAGQTRAVNARSGLMGSDFGVAQAQKTDDFNKAQVKSLEDEKSARIQSVLQNIEDRASAEIQTKKNEALQKYQLEREDYANAQEELRYNQQQSKEEQRYTEEQLRIRQTAAKADLATLAQSGFNLDTLPPDKKAKLFEDAGLDPAFGELVFNAQKPKAAQIDYKFEKLADGQGIFYGVDPLTGQLKQQKVSVDLPPEWQIQIAPDGTVLGYDKKTGEARVLSEQGQFAKPADPVDPLDQAYKQAQIDKIYADIAQGDGDGMLTVEEANKLGVPYGTTKSQAAGVVPGSQDRVKDAETGLVTMNKALALIDELKTHKGLDGATGTFGARINIFGNSRDFVAKFDQLKALLSLESISKLKGTGAISDAEQALLANSATALRRDGDKKKLLQELETLGKEITDKQTKLQNIINVGNNSLINEFESQYGGSEGTNPKAPSTIRPLSSTLSVNTKTLAKAVLPSFPDKSIGGQCITFLHKIAQFPSVGDGKKEKFASVDKFGIPSSEVQSRPKVGMILITDENETYGHGAMINAISKDGKYARLTESNFKGKEKVSHDRVIALNNPKIYGAILPKSFKNIG